MSVDDRADARALRAAEGLSFRLLSDPAGEVIRAYGLLHAEGGLEGEPIAVPAQLLVRPDGTLAWSFVARRITQRAPPADALRALEQL